MADLRGWVWSVLMGLMGLVLTLLFFVNVVEAQEPEVRYFNVTAWNEWGESAFAGEISANIIKGKSVTVGWNSVAGAKYYVYWGKSPGVYFPKIDNGSLTQHIFVAFDPPTGFTFIE